MVIERAIDPPGVWRRAVGSVVPGQFELLAKVDPYDDTLFRHGELDELDREIAAAPRLKIKFVAA